MIKILRIKIFLCVSLFLFFIIDASPIVSNGKNIGITVSFFKKVMEKNPSSDWMIVYIIPGLISSFIAIFFVKLSFILFFKMKDFICRRRSIKLFNKIYKEYGISAFYYKNYESICYQVGLKKDDEIVAFNMSLLSFDKNIMFFYKIKENDMFNLLKNSIDSYEFNFDPDINQELYRRYNKISQA